MTKEAVVEEVVEEAILLPVEMTVLRQIIPQEKVIGPVKNVAQTIFQEEMDALVVTNQEPAREMMTEEMILTEAIVTTDVIVPIKYIFFKDKKKPA